MENPATCPRYHSEEVLPIAYGMPSPGMAEESVASRVALGGRVAWPEAPTGGAFGAATNDPLTMRSPSFAFTRSFTLGG